jgi:CheY-like chemotaxis protein
MDTVQRIRVLVVDDEENEMEKTLQAVRQLGIPYEARRAHDGFEALDYLYGRGRFHERSRHPLPHLVLLDLGMAPVDGLQVLRRIKHAEYLRHIPVVLLCESGHERERAINEAVLAAGSVTKPLATPELRDLVAEWVPWTQNIVPGPSFQLFRMENRA